MLFHSVALLALFAAAQGRAVNISNTWVLPEEGFPVFYRYFRDRISWYEADAVCQFHHANLVTVDTTAQYDAVRAYLKELDISSAVWVGLIRSNPDGDFTWTDYRGLSSEGYWSSAPDTRTSPLCAAADPAADYRWEARACGGPTVASFICELPVPQWALGNEGCMVRALPALTILYLPESAAVQLTADCGLAGVKRVQCTGNMKREDLLKDLSCTEEEETTTTASVTSSGNIWTATTNVMIVDQDTTTETISEANRTIEHEEDANQTSTISLPSSTHNINVVTGYKIPPKPFKINTFNRINNILDNNIHLNLVRSNNLQSNHIPKIANRDNYLQVEQQDKIEDEKQMQHKMLHEEIARLGNLDNIFTQPTDHFVPPLVMAKARISDDMTVQSLEEKHAQQLAEKYLSQQVNQHRQGDHIYESDVMNSTTDEPKTVTVDKTYLVQPVKFSKKDKTKTGTPKKYSEKVIDPKIKVQKTIGIKPIAIDRVTAPMTTVETVTKDIEIDTLPLVGQLEEEEDSSLNLTVFLNDSPETHKNKTLYNYSSDISRLEVVRNSTLKDDTEIKLLDVEATEQMEHEIKTHKNKTFYNYSSDTSTLELVRNSTLKDNTEIKILDVEATEQMEHEIPTKCVQEINRNVTVNNDDVKISIISEGNTTETVFEITTNFPLILNNVSINQPPLITNMEYNITTTNSKNEKETTKASFNMEPAMKVSIDLLLISNIRNNTSEEVEEGPAKLPNISTTNITTVLPIINITLVSNNISIKEKSTEEISSTSSYITREDGITNTNIETHDEYGANCNSSDTLDNFNSPLLSGANEPVRRPNRSRRPLPQPNRIKFNPFRILG